MRINGDHFALRREIFDWIKPGEELVQEPFQFLAEAGKLLLFWALLEDSHARGQRPWEVWKSSP